MAKATKNFILYKTTEGAVRYAEVLPDGTEIKMNRIDEEDGLVGTLYLRKKAMIRLLGSADCKKVHVTVGEGWA